MADDPRTEEPRPRDPGYEDGLDELPPNRPRGFLGDVAPDMRRPEDFDPRGTDAGMIQEWTRQTTVLAVMIAYLLFFPAAFVILWRSRKISRDYKIGATVAMVAGLLYVAYRLYVG